MPDEGFLRRWSRRKTETRLGIEPEPEPAPAPEVAAEALPPPGLAIAADGPAPRAEARLPAPASEADTDAAAPAALPTMDDVATLTQDSDYSGFVARGVDPAVRRSALRKLFADPHFNTMDRLDIYIDDYTKPSPVSEAMLASLRHAARLFERAPDDEAEAAVQAGPQDPQDPPDQQGAPGIAAETASETASTIPPETETR